MAQRRTDLNQAHNVFYSGIDDIRDLMLYKASRDGVLDQVKHLSAAGVMPCVYIYGSSALHIAIENGHTQCVEVLLMHYPWRTFREGLNETPATDYRPQCDMKHTRPYGVDRYGDSPLHTAAKHGQVDAMRLILRKDSSSHLLELKNDRGDTALDIAIERSNSDCIALLSCINKSHFRNETRFLPLRSMWNRRRVAVV